MLQWLAAGDERQAFLARACADDDVLRREVESLLAQESHADGFMRVPPVAHLTPAVTDHAHRTLAGTRLGVYAIG